jgi:CheY-like chemotaxis protein
VLVVSETAAERELIRRATQQVSSAIEMTELSEPGERKAAAEMLAQRNFDVVLFDSRLPKPVRLGYLELLREAPSRPLAVLIAPSAIKTREVFTEGVETDAVLAKPLDLHETIVLIERCIRARQPMRVMIVDDSSTVRSVVNKVIGTCRFRLKAEEASDGASAIELAKRSPFDIVFLDCQMPGLDGFATLAELRKAHPDVKVVMMTGTRDSRMEIRAREHGARSFLYKPFFGKDVDAALNRLFDLAPQQGT